MCTPGGSRPGRRFGGRPVRRSASGEGGRRLQAGRLGVAGSAAGRGCAGDGLPLPGWDRFSRFSRAGKVAPATAGLNSQPCARRQPHGRGGAGPGEVVPDRLGFDPFRDYLTLEVGGQLQGGADHGGGPRVAQHRAARLRSSLSPSTGSSSSRDRLDQPTPKSSTTTCTPASASTPSSAWASCGSGSAVAWRTNAVRRVARSARRCRPAGAGPVRRQQRCGAGRVVPAVLRRALRRADRRGSPARAVRTRPVRGSCSPNSPAPGGPAPGGQARCWTAAGASRPAVPAQFP